MRLVDPGQRVQTGREDLGSGVEQSERLRLAEPASALALTAATVAPAPLTAAAGGTAPSHHALLGR